MEEGMDSEYIRKVETNAIECENCLCEFDREEHKPNNLPCGHTFCTKCINTWISEQKHPKCFKDRRTFTQEELNFPFQLMNIVEAISKAKGKWPKKNIRIKKSIGILGVPGTGKTSIAQRYTNNKFVKESQATLGVDISKVQINMSGGVSLDLLVWDTGGQEIFHSINSTYYKRDGFILVFDITSEESFEGISDWLMNIERMAPKDSPIVIIGNKLDLYKKRQVTYIHANSWSKSHNFQYFECSAKSNIQISAAFLWLASAIISKTEVLPEHIPIQTPIHNNEPLVITKQETKFAASRCRKVKCGKCNK